MTATYSQLFQWLQRECPQGCDVATMAMTLCRARAQDPFEWIHGSHENEWCSGPRWQHVLTEQYLVYMTQQHIRKRTWVRGSDAATASLAVVSSPVTPG